MSGDRTERIQELRRAGMSLRSIAAELGVSKSLVQRELVGFEMDGPVIGRDGKRYGRGWQVKEPVRTRFRGLHDTRVERRTGFLCVDGEAIEGKYCILGTEESVLAQRNSLEGFQIFDWLLALGVSELWGYALTYDINHWLRLLSGRVAMRAPVLDENGDETGDYEILDVDSGRYLAFKLYENEHNYARINRHVDTVNYTYAVQHIYGKLFRLSRWERTGQYRERDDGSRVEVRANLATVSIWDMFAFAGSGSFVNFVEEWNLAERPDEIAWLRDMKRRRGQFTWDDYDLVLEYNRLEMVLLRRGVEKLKSLARGLNLEPRVWYSPGSLAAKAFEQHHIKSHLNRELLDEDEIRQRVLEAYFGGRMEVGILGLIDGPVYHADIHSAYPSVMVTLPSLAGAEWEPIGEGDWQPGQLALLEVSWQAGSEHRFGPFPVRPSAGSIRYPLQSGGRRWLWSTEVEAGLRVPNVSIDVWGGYRLRLESDERPFAWLADFYRRRRELKTAGDDRQYVLKLVINSAYGKTAQRPYKDRVPPYYQPIYAGLITSGCRARLLDVYARHPDLIAFATDGVTSREPLDLDYGEGLGQWECKILDWIFYGQVGVYYYPDQTGRIVSRTRGFGRRAIEFERVLDAWRTGKALTVSERRMVGYRAAIAFGGDDLRDWCEFVDATKRVTITSKPRRRDGERVGDMMFTYPPKRASSIKWDLFLSGGYFFDDDLDQPDHYYEWEAEL